MENEWIFFRSEIFRGFSFIYSVSVGMWASEPASRLKRV